MTTLLLRFEAKPEDELSEYYSDSELSYKEVTLEELLDEQCAYSLKSMGYIKINIKSGNFDKKTIKYLREQGWSHVEATKKREEKKVLKQKYYLIDKNGDKYGFSTCPKFKEINLDELSNEEIKQLARKDTEIVQALTLKSILSSKDYKKVQTQKDQNTAKIEKAKITKEKKAKVKKEKQLKEAKKLLQEAGEI